MERAQAAFLGANPGLTQPRTRPARAAKMPLRNPTPLSRRAPPQTRMPCGDAAYTPPLKTRRPGG